MRPASRLHALLAAIAVAATALAACSHESGDEGAFDALAARCEEQVGATFAGAAAALQGGYAVGAVCSTSLEAMPAADGCGAATADRPVCQVLYCWFSADPAVCEGGACTCELRFLRSALDGQGGAAPVCAAGFLRGQATQ